jgi:hypothetical protein
MNKTKNFLLHLAFWRAAVVLTFSCLVSMQTSLDKVQSFAILNLVHGAISGITKSAQRVDDM